MESNVKRGNRTNKKRAGLNVTRDAFRKKLQRLEKDKSIYFLSADFGAAALDTLRERFQNFLHYGISRTSYVRYSFRPSHRRK